MDVVGFTRQLVDIESITGNEGPVGDFCIWNSPPGIPGREDDRGGRAVQCRRHIARAAASGGGVFHSHGYGAAVHSLLGRCLAVYGRGSCDAKGIIAAQVAAAERLRLEGIYVGLLFLVGEERDSVGAKVANQQAWAASF